MVGPTFLGAYGRQVEFDDNTTAIADDEYMYESVVDPDALIVKGFPPNVMPPGYADQISDEQIRDLIEFIKSLSDN